MTRPTPTIRKIIALAILGMLLCILPAQALTKDLPPTTQTLPSNPTQPKMMADPYFTWGDDFSTEEHIDPELSMDYQDSNGLIGIKNTYTVWTDSAWTRLKPITLTNIVGTPLTDYAVHLTITYESEMQPAYDDIRFKHEDFVTTWLDYWIENADNTSASVWVKIPTIPTGTSMLYLFYGNPDAQSQSDYYSVFTDWQEHWANDEKITVHSNDEGAWDPEVEYGANSYLVLWEEGQALYPPYTWGFKQEIRGAMYDLDGNALVIDKRVFNDGTFYYRNENPAAAFGDGTFFVVWEHYDTVADPSATTEDIKARTVQRNGDQLALGTVQDVCSAPDCQADAHVTYDSINQRFCVMWEDSRNGENNYNVYAHLYDTSGSPIGTEKTICDAANTQCEPWATFDPINQQYLIVWEDGITPNLGPFSIRAGLFNKDLDPIGGTIIIANGTDDTDFNFPCVGFCNLTQRFLITWNDGDISDNDWYGNIWARIIDTSGNTIVDNFILKEGNFIRTDIAPYLSSSFLVSFDSNQDIWGKLISSDGEIFTGDIQLSASTSAVADWANMGVGDGRIFIAWEDTRVDYPYPWNDMPDVYGNIWQLNIPSGSDVTEQIGTEQQLILNAQVTSKPITPENLVSWYQFTATYQGSVLFNILASNGTVLISDAGNGEDLSGIDPLLHPGIRLQAMLTRSNPSYTPTLDSWSVVYVGKDDDPPETTVTEITGDPGQNGWYIGNVRIKLAATDGQHGSGVNHTYFKIDEGAVKEYNPDAGIRLPQDATGDPSTLFGSWKVWYWSVDLAGNTEPLQGPVHIEIDKIQPYCAITQPADRATVPRLGGFWVIASVKDNGSGIAYVSFDMGPPYGDPAVVTSDDPPGSGIYKWFCDRNYAAFQWKHIIAQAYDMAGNMYESNIFVHIAWQFPLLHLLLQLLQWILGKGQLQLSSHIQS